MLRLLYLNTAPLNDDGLYERFLSQASEERRKKAEAYRFRKDKNLSLGAAILLDTVFSEYGLREKDAVYGFGENGKPFAENLPELRFSISHSGEWVIASFSGSETGCDIEEIKKSDLRLAQRFFHSSEYELLAAAPESERDILFCRLWTLKESFIKMSGKGLAMPLGSFRMTFGENGISSEINPAGENSAGKAPCAFAEYDLIPGCRIALCFPGNEAAPVPEAVAILDKR